MNRPVFATALGLAAVGAQAAPFQNLGFDLANTDHLTLSAPPPPLRGTGSTEDLLPGWQLTKGGVPQTTTLETFNVASFAGQTVDLTLTALGPLMPSQPGTSYIDDLVFTVPEPCPWILLAPGLAALGVALRQAGVGKPLFPSDKSSAI